MKWSWIFGTGIALIAFGFIIFWPKATSGLSYPPRDFGSLSPAKQKVISEDFIVRMRAQTTPLTSTEQMALNMAVYATKVNDGNISDGNKMVAKGLGI
jgi:hypothetical protein